MKGIIPASIIEKAKWIGGLAEWHEGETTYLSIGFTWKIPEARDRAVFAKACGRHVIAGGPALFLQSMKDEISDVAEIGKEFPDALRYHNTSATIASRGCPVGCTFCIVPKLEGTTFTLIPDFPVRPILCDNNLSALPLDYQKHIIARYVAEGVPLLDANSGFEPMTFTDEVYALWKPINRGPWRFAYDELRERLDVLRCMKMLKAEHQKRKRVYVLIGNEPFEQCMSRIQEVIDNGCEPHCQPYMDLNALERVPRVRHDWTLRKLMDVARWANGFVWKKVPFTEYDRTIGHAKRQASSYDEQQGLFV